MTGLSVLHPPARADLTLLALTLQRCGWEIREADIDLIAGRAVVRLHRFDGRWLYVAADDLGRASVERWHRRAVVTRYRGGPQCDGFADDFLGRDRREGIRSAMRAACSYIADNPAPGFPALDVGAVRRAIAPLLGAP